MSRYLAVIGIIGVAITLVGGVTRLLGGDDSGDTTSEVTADVIEHLDDEHTLISENRSPDVPELPFDDNPQCG